MPCAFIFPQVMDKLKTLFTGFSESPPTCFILFGNFLSHNSGSKQAAKLKGSFCRRVLLVYLLLLLTICSETLIVKFNRVFL